VIRLKKQDVASSVSCLEKPKGIVLNFLGQAEFNGVVFDNILPDGLMVSPEQKATWKNIFYGEHNLAAPDKLYWEAKSEGSK
jgi:hypothetical protein